jgi:hypothetical protein
MADEKLYKGTGTKTQDGYVPVKEGYQPQPGTVEKGYQPVKQGSNPPANLKIPKFETGIQAPIAPVANDVPAKSRSDK